MNGPKESVAVRRALRELSNELAEFMHAAQQARSADSKLEYWMEQWVTGVQLATLTAWMLCTGMRPELEREFHKRMQDISAAMKSGGLVRPADLLALIECVRKALLDTIEVAEEAAAMASRQSDSLH